MAFMGGRRNKGGHMLPTESLKKRYEQWVRWCATNPSITDEELAARWHVTTGSVSFIRNNFRLCGLPDITDDIMGLYDLRKRLVMSLWHDGRSDNTLKLQNTVRNIRDMVTQGLDMDKRAALEADNG